MSARDKEARVQLAWAALTEEQREQILSESLRQPPTEDERIELALIEGMKLTGKGRPDRRKEKPNALV